MRSLVLAVALVAATGLATGARSDPVLRYTWGDPDAIRTEQSFAGPGVYRQTLSVTGLSGTVAEFWVSLSTGPCWGRPDAWAALCGPDNLDCASRTGFFTWRPAVAGCAPIPGLELGIYFFGAVTNPRGGASIMGRIDPPLVADPETRYAIATFSFDHSYSVTGEGDAAHCGGAEAPFCFGVQDAGFWTTAPGGFAIVVPDYEEHALAWQSTAPSCFDAVPARASSWGRLKTMYR